MENIGFNETTAKLWLMRENLLSAWIAETMIPDLDLVLLHETFQWFLQSKTPNSANAQQAILWPYALWKIEREFPQIRELHIQRVQEVFDEEIISHLKDEGQLDYFLQGYPIEVDILDDIMDWQSRIWEIGYTLYRDIAVRGVSSINQLPQVNLNEIMI